MPINDPTDITGLVFWGDALPANITENPAGQAEIVDNQEGTASEDISQSVSAKRPNIVTVFGKKGLQFTGPSPDDMFLVGGGTVASQSVGTVVMVLRLPPSSGDPTDQFIFTNTSGSGASFLVALVESLVPAIRIEVSNGDDIVSITPDADWALGNDIMITLIWDGGPGSVTIRINKIEKGSGVDASLQFGDGISVGANFAGGFNAPMTMYGLVTYRAILTGTDLTDIEDFMQSAYLPVNILTADAGPDQTVDSDESDTALVILDGTVSFGPDPITNYEWKEGTTVLASSANPIAVVTLATGAHTIVLTVTDINGVDTDTVLHTVNTFVPPTPPTIRSFKEITTSTATVHVFSDVFPLTPRLTLLPFTEFHNQLRVFKKVTAGTVTELFPVGRPSAAGVTDFTINTAGTQITLDDALITSDTLVIMRDTTMFHPFVTFVGASRFHGVDRNVQGDQILFIVQELREIRAIAAILGSGVGDPFEHESTPIDDSKWKQIHTGDAVETDFLYANIEMLPPTAVLQDTQLLVFIDDVLQTIVTDYTVDVDDSTINFVSAPAAAEVIEIRRVTRIDQRWVTFRDGSTFSSLQDIWDFRNVQFIIEETINFPVFLAPNALSNRIFPRALNLLNYSGPGNRFFFGNLPWFGDGTVFIFKNDLLLVELVDYTIDFTFFNINLTTALVSADTLRIVATTPNHAFGRLSLGISGGGGEGVEAVSDDFDTVGEIDRSDGDTVLVESLPTQNFNKTTSLPTIGLVFPPTIIPALQFDVSNIDPANFSAIKLQITRIAALGNTGTLLIRRCLRTWNLVTGLTWDEFAVGLAWASPGGRGSDTDFDLASQVSWVVPVSTAAPFFATYISPDISALITAARAGDNVLRILIDPQNAGIGFAAASREHAFDLYHPRLIFDA